MALGYESDSSMYQGYINVILLCIKDILKGELGRVPAFISHSLKYEKHPPFVRDEYLSCIILFVYITHSLSPSKISLLFCGAGFHLEIISDISDILEFLEQIW